MWHDKIEAWVLGPAGIQFQVDDVAVGLRVVV
jgi:hypothetical protein